MNIITNQADKYNIKFIVFICIVSLISPIVGFVLSILFFRQRISVVIFILFSFYFGWFYEPQLDLLNHYNHFKSNIGKSLLEQWSDPDTMCG